MCLMCFNYFTGFVSIPCSADLSPSTVYNYLVFNSNIYDLAKVQVCTDPASSVASSHVLTYSYGTNKEPIQFSENWRNRRDKTEYDGNVAIHFIPAEDVDVLNLPFFIALGNKKEFYPRPYMLSNLSSLKGRQRGSSTVEHDIFGKCNCTQCPLLIEIIFQFYVHQCL